jgi:hypothetical protein
VDREVVTSHNEPSEFGITSCLLVIRRESEEVSVDATVGFRERSDEISAP